MSDIKILVIGGGLFGLDLAIELAQNGFDVTLIEKKTRILEGTTRSSLLRVHSGLHYPRHFETAKQSMLGFDLFKAKYINYVYDSFVNYYAISKINSKISSEQFEFFAKKLGFPYEKCENNLDSNLEFNRSKLSSIYKVGEGVIDIPKLRSYFIENLKSLSVKLLTGSEVTYLERSKTRSSWLVSYKSLISDTKNVDSNEVSKGEYQFVIDATHSVNNYLNSIQEQNNNEYQITHMLNIECKSSPFGLTVLDGNFLSILPLVENGKVSLTLYAPLPSVRARYIGSSAPPAWLNSSNLENFFSLAEAEQQILRAADEWAPGLLSPKVISTKTGIRVIESNVSDTDRRQSMVKSIAPGLYSIVSTKLDHCIEISAHLLKLVKESLK
jgi:hypothetical protein